MNGYLYTMFRYPYLSTSSVQQLCKISEQRHNGIVYDAKYSWNFLSSRHLADSSGQLSSSPLSSSTGHRGISNHPLHQPLLSPSAMSSSPGQLHSPISTLSSPINGLSSPFPVISSPMGHPSMSGPSSTSMTFRPSLSPQVRHHCIYCGLI